MSAFIFPRALSLLKFIIPANPAREIQTGRAFVPGLLGQVSPDPTSQCSNHSDIALETLGLVYYRRTGKRVRLNIHGTTLPRVPRFVCSDTGRTFPTTGDHAGVPLNIPLEGDEILQDCILEQKISPFPAFTLEPKICPASYAPVHFVSPSAWSGSWGSWGYSIAAPPTGFRTLGPATVGILPSNTNSVLSNIAFLQHPLSFYPGVCLNIPLRSQFFVDSTLVEDDQLVDYEGNSSYNFVQDPKDGPMSTDGGFLVGTTQVIGKLTAFSNYFRTLDMSRFLRILGYGPRFCRLVSHYLLDGVVSVSYSIQSSSIELFLRTSYPSSIPLPYTPMVTRCRTLRICRNLIKTIWVILSLASSF